MSKRRQALLLAAVIYFIVFLNIFQTANLLGGCSEQTDSSDNFFQPHLGDLTLSNAENFTIQSLILTPEPGIVAAIGTTAFLPCPPLAYDHPSHITLKYENKRRFMAKNITDLMLQAGPLIFAYYNVGIPRWEDWRTAANATKLLIQDNRANTAHYLPVLVDPALRQHDQKHRVSLTTTIRKAHKHYNGIDTDAGTTDGTKIDRWSAQEIETLLHFWLDHHRREGVDHFYILDNEQDGTIPNIDVSGSDITYIRSPYMDYDWMTPCHFSLFDDWEGIRHENHHHYMGQLIMENTVLRMAHTDWLLSCDLDEYFVVGDEFDRSIPTLLNYFKHVVCRPVSENTRMACNQVFDVGMTKETNHSQTIVFAVSFSEHTMKLWGAGYDPNIHRRKLALRPSLTYHFSVHYPTPHVAENMKVLSHDADLLGHVIESFAPVRQGWIAHFRKDKGPFDLAQLIPLIHRYRRYA